jgi:hypothetical protein
MILDFLYSHTFLSCVLYRYTIAYRRLFPDGQFLDPDTPYKDEVELIRKAIKRPSFQLQEMDMGIVLSQLIQSDVNYSEAQKICAIINRKYKDKPYFQFRWHVVSLELSELNRKIQDFRIKSE